MTPISDSGPPQPAWQGDVSIGVDAWTASAPDWAVDRERGARSADGPDAGVSTGDGRSAARTGRRGGGRRAGRNSGTRGRDRRAQEPPEGRDLGPEPDHESVARKILLDTLTGQARSRKELADKLAKKDVPEEIAAALLDRFQEVGLVDDEAFARAWIASRQPGKGLARRALAQELRRKGIADEVARDALDEIDPDDEERAARSLVRKKLRTMRSLEPQVATRRLVAMLARKGYPPGLAFTVVRDELDADQETLEQVADDW